MAFALLSVMAIRRYARQTWYFMVATAPPMMPVSATKEPMASVETPDNPWPMVQPMAVTPPKPIRTAPSSRLRRSSKEAKPSPFHRKWPDGNAYAQDPIATPTALATPNDTLSDLSVHNSSNSRL